MLLQYILLPFNNVKFCNVELWPEETKDKACLNYQSADVATNQTECQEKCLETFACIGIAYSHNDAIIPYCVICLRDVLEPSINPYGYGFYRRPGRKTNIEL